MHPAAVAYVAVHGTGTPLGDPIEVGALGAALGGKGSGGDERPTPLGIGSNKVPHSEPFDQKNLAASKPASYFVCVPYTPVCCWPTPSKWAQWALH